MLWPPALLQGTKPGTACVITSWPTGPGSYPIYKCWFMPNDSITPIYPLYQQAGMNNWYGWWCGPTTWGGVIHTRAGPSSGLTYSTSPLTTGLEQWDCAREDIFSGTISRGNNNNSGWDEETFFQGVNSPQVCNGTNCVCCIWEIAADFVSVPGPAPAILPTAPPTPYGGGGPWPTPGPQLEIYDNIRGQAVSDGLMRSTVVGLKNDLTAKLTDGTPVSAQWSYDDTSRITSQTVSQATASSVTPPPNPVPAPESTYYWYQGQSPSRVWVTATVNGQQLAAVSFWNIEAPSSPTMNAFLTAAQLIACPNGVKFYAGLLRLPAPTGHRWHCIQLFCNQPAGLRWLVYRESDN